MNLALPATCGDFLAYALLLYKRFIINNIHCLIDALGRAKRSVYC